MKRLLKCGVVVLVAALGVWGCAQGPGATSGGDRERIRKLEAQCARLEADYSGAAAARDKACKEAADLREQTTRLEQTESELRKELEQARAVAEEHEQLKQQLEQQKIEVKNLHSRCETLRSTMRKALEEIDAMNPTASPAAPVISTSEHGNSGS
jgi:chromosome segregation ATPase